MSCNWSYRCNQVEPLEEQQMLLTAEPSSTYTLRIFITILMLTVLYFIYGLETSFGSH